MFDIDTKNVKKGRKFYYTFLLIGIYGFFMLMIMTISNITTWNSLNSFVLSTDVSVDRHAHLKYSAVYHYNVAGKEYLCKSSIISSKFPSLENKLIYYDSASPAKCMVKSSKFSNYIMLLYWLVPILFLEVSVINIKYINRRLKTIMELNKKGRLVKNLPYRLEKTGMSSKGVAIKRVVVDYTLPSGKVITLYGDPRHDNKLCDADLMVDLLIDENNLDNYYIDFEINRLSGNLPQDYYSKNSPKTPNNQNQQKQ